MDVLPLGHEHFPDEVNQTDTQSSRQTDRKKIKTERKERTNHPTNQPTNEQINRGAFHVSTRWVCRLLPVALSIETSSQRSSVSLWNRFLRDVRLFFFKSRATFTLTKYLEKSCCHHRDFPITVRCELRV